jgi:hypothetical protein
MSFSASSMQGKGVRESAKGRMGAPAKGRFRVRKLYRPLKEGLLMAPLLGNELPGLRRTLSSRYDHTVPPERGASRLESPFRRCAHSPLSPTPGFWLLNPASELLALSP